MNSTRTDVSDVPDITQFSDLGVDVPFEYGDAIHDTDTGQVIIPRAIGPSDGNGVRVYAFVHPDVRETRRGNLKINEAGVPGPKNIPLTLINSVLNKDTSRIVDSDIIRA